MPYSDEFDCNKETIWDRDFRAISAALATHFSFMQSAASPVWAHAAADWADQMATVRKERQPK